MKESKRRPTSAEFERGAIVPVVMENNSNNNNYNVGASSSNSPVCASSINDSYLKPQGLLGKVASFRHLRKKNKNKNNTDSSPRARRTTKRGKNPVPEIEGIPELHMTVVPGPPSAGQLTTPSGASSLSPAGSVGRASSRSFFERSSPFSMSLPSTAFSSFGPPSPCSAPAATDPPRVLPKDVKGDISKFQLEGYARKYFKSRKKGIFKRQVPIQELLTFQKKDMTSPLLDLKNKPELCATAIRMFHLILTYQGLKKPLKPAEEISTARELLQEALREGQIRDEVYCQVCKQTCNTPTTELLYKGWELMTLCCVTFPPTRNFEEWLRKHLWEHTKRSDPKEAAFATFCVRKLDLICEAPPSIRLPSNYEIEKIREAPFCSSPFGVTLQEIMDAQKEKSVHLEVPEIMVHLCEGILKLNGHSALGIFRIKGDPKRTHELKVDLECCNYALETVNPHDLANLLKAWLRELSEPLIPFELQSRCLTAGNNVRDVLQVVNKLPTINKKTMRYLVDFLRSFLSPEMEAKTKMSATNIAAVFAPNLIRSADNQITMENSKVEQDFVSTLLLHWSG